MKRPDGVWRRSAVVVLTAGAVTTVAAVHAQTPAAPRPQPNAAGTALTVTTQRRIDPRSAFFASLGANGRTCGSCHLESDGWSLTPETAQAKFAATGGADPIFRTNDGSNAPGLDVSTPDARRSAFSLLLNRAVIRIGLPVPAGAEFRLVEADDPYGFATAAELSLFRRPLPAANLKFHPVIMWDGRETRPGLSAGQVLANQAAGATTGHAQAPARPADAALTQIVGFETALFHAQKTDRVAGALDSGGVKGGPTTLSRQRFAPGINDPFAAGFDPNVFQIFAGFARPRRGTPANVAERRRQIAQGEAIFNAKRFFVRDVPGLNDDRGQPVVTATCGTCHNAPGVGSSSVGAFQNIGVSDADRRTPDVPLYTFEHNTTGERVQITDPGRALISGRWRDMGRFKVPSLRGLAARRPYFHDGSAATLRDVVDFYNRRFSINLSPGEQEALTAFMEAL